MKIFLQILLIFIISSCASSQRKEKIVLKEVDFTSLPGWTTDDHHEALPAFIKSCQRISKMPNHKSIGASNIAGKSKDWKKICREAKNIAVNDKKKAKHFFEKHFTPYKVFNGQKETGLFTGYFEIDLKGSLKKTKKYKYPLYRAPENLSDIKESLSREAIEEGALKGKGLELMYVDDPVRLFFLHIQGSGRIHLPDGKIIRVGYAAQNGHPYYAIGRYLGESGKLKNEKVSAGTIQQWLYKHPKEAIKVMQMNPSYVFFRLISNKEGPIGAHTVPLTPMRSLAIDRRYIPLGVPLWLTTECPDCRTSKHQYLRQLMIAQDTGGAIKGPIRGDIFFGHGKQAEQFAGYMKNRGSYYMLIPSSISVKTN
jgi:membrane-bound lytic murein transglycosylase A